MQTYTQTYHDAISAADREIRGYIKFNGTFVLDGAGGLISFKTTQNAMDAERFCVGSVCSAMCEASFYNEGLEGSGVSLANSYFDAYIGVVTDSDNNTVEYVCCGRYYISEITRSTATTRIVGYDIAGRLSMDYVPTVTADPDHGYLVMDILNDIISQTGVNGGDPFTTFGDDVYVPKIYEGNCRAQWGWLCSLVDGTASNYSGTREPADLGYIKTYVAGNGVATPYAVDETTTYMDGLSLGDAYTITSFTSGTTDEPIVVGNGTGLYGLNPYMTTAVATTIEQSMDNYTYYPATLHWRGDPCLDILDEINVTKGEDTFKVVAMKIETTFNGGLEQTISCFGDSETYYALSTSPTQGQINRVSNLVQEIQQAIETADGGVITKILDTDGTWKELVIANNQDLSQATSVWRFNINGLAHSNRYQGGTYTLAMDTQGRIVANVIQTGILQDAQGNNSWNLDTGAFTITNGSINITTASETYDVIKFQNNEWKNAFSPLEYRVWNTDRKKAVILQAGGQFYYDDYVENSSNTLRLSVHQGGVVAYDENGVKRQALTGTGKLQQYDQNEILRTYLEYGDIHLYDAANVDRTHLNSSSDVYLKDSSGTTRSHLNGEGKLWQCDSNGKVRTYLEFGDIHLKNASEVTRTHLNSQGELEQFDTNSKRRTYLGWGDLYLYDATPTVRTHLDSTGKAEFKDSNGKLRVQVNSDSTVRLYDANATEQTQIRNTASSSWYTGRYYASLISKVAPSSMGTYLPVVSVKGYSSDWSIGTLSNHLYFVNTTDSAYNNGRNYYLKYELEYADTSGGAKSYSILTTKNTTDRVIEQGTSSLGVRYRKWASGWGECWYTVALASRAFSAWGNSYYSPELGVVAFPIAFSSAPREYVSPISGSAWCWIASSDTAPTTTKSGGYRAMRPVSGSANVGLTIYSCGQLA